MKIIVAGSLGNTSKPLAIKLVKKGHSVTVISTQPEKQKDIEAMGAAAPNEVAKVSGEATGKPDLKWVVVPDAQLLNSMIAAGMNPQTARGMVEMNASRREGELYADYDRNKPTLGKIKLKDFAKDFEAFYDRRN